MVDNDNDSGREKILFTAKNWDVSNIILSMFEKILLES